MTKGYCSRTKYFKCRNFREQKVSRISRILAKFAKVYDFKNSKITNSRKFMLAKFSQILICKYLQQICPNLTKFRCQNTKINGNSRKFMFRKKIFCLIRESLCRKFRKFLHSRNFLLAKVTALKVFHTV